MDVKNLLKKELEDREQEFLIYKERFDEIKKIREQFNNKELIDETKIPDLFDYKKLCVDYIRTYNILNIYKEFIEYYSGLEFQQGFIGEYKNIDNFRVYDIEKNTPYTDDLCMLYIFGKKIPINYSDKMSFEERKKQIFEMIFQTLINHGFTYEDINKGINEIAYSMGGTSKENNFELNN